LLHPLVLQQATVELVVQVVAHEAAGAFKLLVLSSLLKIKTKTHQVLKFNNYKTAAFNKLLDKTHMMLS